MIWQILLSEKCTARCSALNERSLSCLLLCLHFLATEGKRPSSPILPSSAVLVKCLQLSKFCCQGTECCAALIGWSISMFAATQCLPLFPVLVWLCLDASMALHHLQVYKAQVGDREVAVKAINRQHVNPSLSAEQALKALQKVSPLQQCIA